jgi:hypothetical protein
MIDNNEDFEFLAEILNEQEEVKPISLGGGLIEYRKYVWALKFLEEKALKLEEYRQQVVSDIDKAIQGKRSTIEHLKGEIKRAMLADAAVDKTPTGGKTLQLPDIATISISKLQKKIDITDSQAVLDELGEEYSKVTVSLNTTKAKEYILESGNLPKGAEEREDRTMTVRFKK